MRYLLVILLIPALASAQELDDLPDLSGRSRYERQQDELIELQRENNKLLKEERDERAYKEARDYLDRANHIPSMRERRQYDDRDED